VPADPSSLRFDRLADDVEALREHLGRGARRPARALRRLPRRAGLRARAPARVRSLVLVDAERPAAGRRPRRRRGDPRGPLGEPWYADAAEAQDALASAPPSQAQTLTRATRPFFYGHWDERTQAHAATADSQSSKRAELGFGAGTEHLDVAALVAGLRAVEAPVLVLGGERDALTGVASVHRVAASFASASTVVLERAGHFPWVDERTPSARPSKRSCRNADGLRTRVYRRPRDVREPAASPPRRGPLLGRLPVAGRGAGRPPSDPDREPSHEHRP
jgi:hypothetical protein